MKNNINKEAGMKVRTLGAVAVAFMSMGCGVWINSPDGHHHDGSGDVLESHAYVDTYLSIPVEVSDLIAPSVEGYFSPALSRYDDYLYPSDATYDPTDLPCFVKSDFNGDGYNDYAFLFCSEEWDYDTWYLTTKLVVVLSTRNGYEIGADEILGTVSADANVPVEEYWSIFRVSEGSHSITTIKNGATITKTITLSNDGFYLASLDPQEEALFYAAGIDVYEMGLDAGLAKKQALSKTAGSEKKLIPFNKNVEGRVRPVK
jgi:hypothetical protein